MQKVGGLISEVNESFKLHEKCFVASFKVIQRWHAQYFGSFVSMSCKWEDLLITVNNLINVAAFLLWQEIQLWNDAVDLTFPWIQFISGV